jgi:hypothetical protein
MAELDLLKWKDEEGVSSSQQQAEEEKKKKEAEVLRQLLKLFC